MQKVVLGADGAMFSSTVPSRAAVGYSLWANTDSIHTTPGRDMAQVAQKTILTWCKTKADATGIAPT